LPGLPQEARITPRDLVDAGRSHAADRRRPCDGIHAAVVEGLLHFAEQSCPLSPQNGVSRGRPTSAVHNFWPTRRS
jgi:hypothetical protein